MALAKFHQASMPVEIIPSAAIKSTCRSIRVDWKIVILVFVEDLKPSTSQSGQLNQSSPLFFTQNIQPTDQVFVV